MEAIKLRAAALPIGNVNEASAQLGPVISERSRQRIASFVGNALPGEGEDVVLDGRRQTGGEGWYFGPTIIDHVKPGMAAHRDEISAPLFLSCAQTLIKRPLP